jgi:hypothetical protein
LSCHFVGELLVGRGHVDLGRLPPEGAQLRDFTVFVIL